MNPAGHVWRLMGVYDAAEHSWKSRGACRGMNPDFWVPERGGVSHADQKAICAGCPSKDPCREFAIEHSLVGIWGGTSDRERRRIKKARKQGAAA